jgi:hypothetical protein
MLCCLFEALCHSNAGRSLVGISFRECDREYTVFKLGSDVFGLRALGKRKGSTELSRTSLANGVSILGLLRRGVGFARYDELVVRYIYLDILFVQSRQFEGCGDLVGLSIFVKIEPG